MHELPYSVDHTGKPIFNPAVYNWQKVNNNPECGDWKTQIYKHNRISMSWLNTIDKNNPYNHGRLDYGKPWVPKDYKK